jgi:hypothetical protein
MLKKPEELIIFLHARGAKISFVFFPGELYTLAAM